MLSSSQLLPAPKFRRPVVLLLLPLVYTRHMLQTAPTLGQKTKYKSLLRTKNCQSCTFLQIFSITSLVQNTDFK